MIETGAAATRGVRLEIDGVGKVFGLDSDNPFEALRPLTIDIRPGEFVSVVGPSGCGKSTLMLMVAGLLDPTSGVVRVGGKPLTGPMTDVGIVFQDHLLLEFRTAEDNVPPGRVVEELWIDISRPRPLALGEDPGLAHYSKRIYDHFARLGVIHGKLTAKTGNRADGEN